VLMLDAAWRDWNAVRNGPRVNSAIPGPCIPFLGLVVNWIHHWGGAGPVLVVVVVVVACTLNDLLVY
jgi:hypothetical protein